MSHRQGGQQWLLIGLMLVVVLVAHDLFMTDTTLAGKGSQLDPSGQTLSSTAAFETTPHHMHVGERNAETLSSCTAIQPGLNPERSAPVRIAGSGFVDLAAGFPAVRHMADKRTVVPISPQHRCALLQVFLL